MRSPVWFVAPFGVGQRGLTSNERRNLFLGTTKCQELTRYVTKSGHSTYSNPLKKSLGNRSDGEISFIVNGLKGARQSLFVTKSEQRAILVLQGLARRVHADDLISHAI